MRIIAGTRKGMKLIAPKGLHTRPTDDRLKENAFNLLGPIDSGASVLDICAGTGQIGLEFLSRGAGYAIFLENDRRAVQAIEDNVQKTRFQDQTKIVFGDALRYLERYQGPAFRYLYADPPYDAAQNFLERLFAIFRNSGIMSVGSALMIEVPSRFVLPEGTVVKERVYGARKIVILGVDDEEGCISREF